MNRYVLLVSSTVAFIAVGFFLGQSRGSQAPGVDTAKSTGTIEAVGSATVSGKPDSARLYFGVVTQNNELVVARQENGRAVEKIQSAIRALKLSELKAKTRDLSISALHDENDKNKVVGYEVRQVFSILVFEPDTEKLGAVAAKVYDIAIQNGANARGDVEFFKGDDTDMQLHAKTKAVENAIANAQAYAQGATVRTTGIAQISENDNRWSWGGFGGGFNGGLGALGGAGGASPTPAFIAGNWQVTSQVRVVMKY